MNKNLSFLFCFISFSSISNATIWVGGDANCDYTSIQPALDELVQGNEVQLYIANNNPGNGVYTENLTMVNNRDVQIRIKGGYNTCGGTVTEVNTEINGGGIAPVMNISGDDTLSNIGLSNLSLTNGLYDNNFHAGGLNIEDEQLSINLYRMNISNNQGYYGGGIFSKGGSGLRMRLYNSLVFNNTAEYGGGMYCLNGHVITVWDRSGIAYNAASSASELAGNGGGMYLQGCQVIMSSGNVGLNNLEGIIGNTATGHGGGTYINSDSLLDLQQRFGGGKYIVYSDNVADSNNNGSGDGGAIYLSGIAARMTTNGRDILINNNTAANGGAIALANDSYAYIRSVDNSQCTMKTPCISFVGNKAIKSLNGQHQGLGGTFYVNDAYLYVSRTEITDSQADVGVIGYIENGEIELDFTVIHNNGNTPSEQFNQYNLFNAIVGQLKLSHVTLTDNIIDASQALLFAFNGAEIQVYNSILQGENNPVFEGFTTSGNMNEIAFKCNLMHEDNSIGTTGNISDNIVTSTPGFLNSLEQDYRLATNSVAIDKCDSVVTSVIAQVDLEGQLTGIDDPTITNVLGTHDAGADESYLWDVIFTDDFE